MLMDKSVNRGDIMPNSHAQPRKPAGLGRIRALWSNRKGVAAVEFAFMAPMLLSVYLMTMEISQGIDTNKKVGRIASMVADLITQQQEITTGELTAIMRIGAAVIQPYSRSAPVIEITAITITDEDVPKAKVAWSRKLVAGVASAGTAKDTVLTSVPAALMIRDSFLIKVRTELDYRPLLTWSASQKESLGLSSAFDNISMGEEYLLRPRMSASITCATC